MRKLSHAEWYKEIKEITPRNARGYNLGIGGLGVDCQGFRIVMYPPRESNGHAAPKFDSEYAAWKEEQTEIQLGDGDALPNDKTATRFRLRGKAIVNKPPCNQGEHHGPAHVHVFDLRRVPSEIRFELLESVEGEPWARPLYTNGTYKHPLNKQEIAAVQPILDQAAPAFIQLWRELYPKTLGRYVTRITPKGNGYIEEKYNTDGEPLKTYLKQLYEPAGHNGAHNGNGAHLSKTRDSDGFYHTGNGSSSRKR